MQSFGGHNNLKIWRYSVRQSMIYQLVLREHAQPPGLFCILIIVMAEIDEIPASNQVL